ncbi:MAG: hypothetical protein MJZ20_02845 [Bacteroidaceae bacterium]|nr:hypothetical protein [Bacteroidaceae bacterium]
MVGVEDEDWETIGGAEMFPDISEYLWDDIPDDTLTRRNRQIACERKYGRDKIKFADYRYSEGFLWAEWNLIPIPLLREDVIGRVHKYEFNPVTKRYQRKEVVAEKISLDQLYRMRLDLIEQFDAETKGGKDGI